MERLTRSDGTAVVAYASGDNDAIVDYSHSGGDTSQKQDLGE